MGPLPSSPDRTHQDGPSARGPQLDPISQQILDRTTSAGSSTNNLSSVGNADDRDPARLRPTPDAASVPSSRVDTNSSSNKLTKERDKKKGVSFLSRIMGAKKREELSQIDDATTIDSIENRVADDEAEVLSGPLGFIPRLPGPTKYIRVKAHNRKTKSFDRLFLAQVLLGDQPRAANRRISIDSKIRSIDDGPSIEAQSPARRKGNKAIWAMEVSKDGRFLAAGGQDRKVRVWEVIQTPEDRYSNPGIGPRGTRSGSGSVSSCGNDSEQPMKLHAPVFKQTLVREYDGHTASILDLSWSKNNFLLSSSMDKTVRLYHISRPECLCAFRHNDFVTSIQFHPRDDRFFLAGSLDSKLRLWSIPDRTVAYSQTVGDMVTAVAFTPDGRTAIAGTLTGLCILYDTEGLKPHSQITVKSTVRGKHSHGSKITGIDTIALQDENDRSDVKLLITSNDSRIRMYNLRDRTLEVKFHGNQNSCSQIHATFSDDAKFVICGSEDRKIYIWPTGASDHSDGDKDKHPFEVFEAHSSIATTALLLPTSTRRLFAQSGDPIYDICNPPPVTLLSRADSVLSSRTQDRHSATCSVDEKRLSGVAVASQGSESPRGRPAVETPAYLARHDHYCGPIIVTADYTGQIKVFRQDCAYQKRRNDSWDDTFTKKSLARSGSSLTRYSSTSKRRNQSHTVALTSGGGGSKRGSSERILSWRKSINLTHSTGTTTIGSVGGVGAGGSNSSVAESSDLNSSLRTSPSSAMRRQASDNTSPTSPTSWTRRLSLHLDGTRKRNSNVAVASALANNRDNKIDTKQKRESMVMATPAVGPNIELTPDTPAQSKGTRETPVIITDGGGSTSEQQESKSPQPRPPPLSAVASATSNRLLLLENQYRMGLSDFTNSLQPLMAARQRSYDASAVEDRNDSSNNLRISRQPSFVSDLSSDLPSSDGDHASSSYHNSSTNSNVRPPAALSAERRSPQTTASYGSSSSSNLNHDSNNVVGSKSTR